VSTVSVSQSAAWGNAALPAHGPRLHPEDQGRVEGGGPPADPPPDDRGRAAGTPVDIGTHHPGNRRLLRREQEEVVQPAYNIIRNAQIQLSSIGLL